jgi:TM2 domain-containing membrane protein YozV
MEISETRKVNPLPVFVAGFCGFGLGYVYVGRLRAGLATFVGFDATSGWFYVAWSIIFSLAITTRRAILFGYEPFTIPSSLGLPAAFMPRVRNECL